MRRFSAVILVGIAVLVLMFPEVGECRRRDNLYHRLSEKDVVKVYVLDVTDSSGKAVADLKALKQELETALVTRMTLNFELVPKKEAADIVISCDVKEFVWTDSDPIDMVGGIGPLAWDLVNDDNYGRMQAVLTVIDGNGHKKLWEDRLRATITHDTMTESDSVHMLNERLIKIFMMKCFSKNYGKKTRF